MEAINIETIKKEMAEDEADFINSVERLRQKLGVSHFTSRTLYFLGKLSTYYDQDLEEYESLGTLEQEQIFSLLREHLAEERRDDVQDKESFKTALLDVASDYEKIILSAVLSKADWSKAGQSAPEANTVEADSVQPNEVTREPERIPVGLEVFSPQEREGIAAIADYQAVLCGELPQVRAFREKYLSSGLLSSTQAQAFLTSPALRYLSLSDFEKVGVPLLDHRSAILNQAIEILTPAQRKQLRGDVTGYPSSTSHYTMEGKVSHWYKYTVSVELTSGGAGVVDRRRYVVEKTLVADRRPVKLLNDNLLVKAIGSEREPRRFTRFFTNSVIDELYDMLSSRTVMTSIPGNIREMAQFVLTDKADYRPVFVQINKSNVTDVDASESGRRFAECLASGKALRDTIQIDTEAWITADTIRKIYLEQQSSLNQSAGGTPRYKTANKHTLSLVSAVVDLYRHRNVTMIYQEVYRSLHEAGKIADTVDGFRKKYKRACAILNLPVDIHDVVEYLHKRR